MLQLVFSRQFSNFEGQFLRKTITAVCDVMARNDYDVLLAMVGEQEAQPVQRLLVNHKIDGVILARSLERDPLIPLLQQSKLPFIAIGRPADPTVLYVDHDQVGGCREMTNLLLMKGLHRIALLGGSMLYTVNQTRLGGLPPGARAQRCKIDETLLFLELETDDLRIDAIQQAVARKADCLLCMDDHVAMLALNTVRQMGLKVPMTSVLLRCMTARPCWIARRRSRRCLSTPNCWANAPHSNCWPSPAASPSRPAPCLATRWACAPRHRPDFAPVIQ